MGNDFDQFAVNYDEAINAGLRFTGESRFFFAETRMRWLARRLNRRGFVPHRGLDFGCGNGGSLPFFFQHLSLDSVVAVDLSADSLAEAKRQWPTLKVNYQLESQFDPAGDLDLVFCNGVFHHIPVAARSTVMSRLYAALRPGGYFAFWENNPYNPMTRFIMSRVAFDREAILVWPRQAKRLLRAAGFEVRSADFLFIFPGCLACLRVIEPCLSSFPLGGQYLVLAQKPVSVGSSNKSRAAEPAPQS
jgi:SAM-dependent methyltransferase